MSRDRNIIHEVRPAVYNRMYDKVRRWSVEHGIDLSDRKVRHGAERLIEELFTLVKNDVKGKETKK